MTFWGDSSGNGRDLIFVWVPVTDASREARLGNRLLAPTSEPVWNQPAQVLPAATPEQLEQFMEEWHFPIYMRGYYEWRRKHGFEPTFPQSQRFFNWQRILWEREDMAGMLLESTSGSG